MAVSEEELKALIEANKALTERLQKVEGLINPEGTGTMRLLKRVTEKIVEVRRIDGKVVIGYKNKGTENEPVYVYSKPDPKDPTQKLEYVDLILEGMQTGEYLTLPYGEFRKQSERVKVKVAKTEEKEWEINQGIVRKREIDGYSSMELDFDVPVDVVGKIRLYTVDMPDGHQVTVHENFVNIA